MQVLHTVAWHLPCILHSASRNKNVPWIAGASRPRRLTISAWESVFLDMICFRYDPITIFLIHVPGSLSNQIPPCPGSGFPWGNSFGRWPRYVHDVQIIFNYSIFSGIVILSAEFNQKFHCFFFSRSAPAGPVMGAEKWPAFSPVLAYTCYHSTVW